MGNKQQLQLNNETLDSILSKVLGLPTQESLKHGAYVWKKLTAQGGDFVDFVVSDSPTAYPDGAEQDGYWYEKVKGFEGFLEGDFSKVAVDKFTFAEDFSCGSAGTNGHVLFDHSLGVIPRMAILTGKNITKNSSTSYLSTAVTMLRQTKYLTMYRYSRTGGEAYDGSVNGISTLASTAESTSEKVAFALNTTYLEAGKEYTLITMA